MAVLKHFFAMGGYAFYVWTAYSMALIVFAGNSCWNRYQRRQIIRKLKQKSQVKQISL